MVDAPKEAPKRSHIPVSVPRMLMERVDRVLEAHPILGYTNRSSFVEEALRRWVEREEDRGKFLAESPGDRSSDLDAKPRRRQV